MSSMTMRHPGYSLGKLGALFKKPAKVSDSKGRNLPTLLKTPNLNETSPDFTNEKLPTIAIDEAHIAELMRSTSPYSIADSDTVVATLASSGLDSLSRLGTHHSSDASDTSSTAVSDEEGDRLKSESISNSDDASVVTFEYERSTTPSPAQNHPPHGDELIDAHQLSGNHTSSPPGLQPQTYRQRGIATFTDSKAALLPINSHAAGSVPQKQSLLIDKPLPKLPFSIDKPLPRIPQQPLRLDKDLPQIPQTASENAITPVLCSNSLFSCTNATSVPSVPVDDLPKPSHALVEAPTEVPPSCADDSATEDADNQPRGPGKQGVPYSMSLNFLGAHIVMGNGTNNIGCNNSITVNDCQDLIDFLSLNRLAYAQRALFENLTDSSHRPACTDGTRTDILERLTGWSLDPHSKMCWLYGIAGTGTTTISQSFAQLLSSRGLLAGSFFCSEIYDECAQPDKVFPTIAIQLARMSPAFAAQLSAVLKKDPDAGVHYIDRQFHDLIATPLSCLSAHDKEAFNKIIVIDALDECHSGDGIKAVLKAIVSFGQHGIPLRIFVASHDNQILKRSLKGMSRCSSIPLHEVPKEVVSSDIETYLRVTLLTLASERDVVYNGEWPPPHELGIVTKRADGLFIYAATVCRYVVNGPDMPERLAYVTSESFSIRDAGKESARIDSLYRGILAKAYSTMVQSEKDKLRLILSAIVFLCNPLSLRALSTFLNIPIHTIESYLSELHSVIVVPPDPDGIISIFHSSFPEFLTDKERSPELYIEKAEAHKRIAIRCLELLNAKLHQNICDLPTEVQNIDVTVEMVHGHIDEAMGYAAVHWVSHLLNSGSASCPSVDQVVGSFLDKHLLHWLECLSILRQMRVAQSSLDVLERCLQKQESHLKRLCHAKSVVNENFDAISRCWFELYRCSRDSQSNRLLAHEDRSRLAVTTIAMDRQSSADSVYLSPMSPGGYGC